MDKTLRSARGLVALTLLAALGGCAAQGAAGDPGFKPLPPGHTCKSVRAELNRLDARGVPAKVEAVSAGRKVSASDRAAAAEYNKLLNYYLGGRCHV